MVTHKYKIYIYFLMDGAPQTYTITWSTEPTRETIDTLCSSIDRDEPYHKITFTSYSVSLLTTVETTLENEIQLLQEVSQ